MNCPLCGGTIKKIRENHLIKCEKNVYKDNKHSGCKFMMNLSPTPLNGYVFNKDEVATMIGGGVIDVNGIKARFDADEKYNPFLVFPEMEDF